MYRFVFWSVAMCASASVATSESLNNACISLCKKVTNCKTSSCISRDGNQICEDLVIIEKDKGSPVSCLVAVAELDTPDLSKSFAKIPESTISVFSFGKAVSDASTAVNGTSEAMASTPPPSLAQVHVGLQLVDLCLRLLSLRNGCHSRCRYGNSSYNCNRRRRSSWSNYSDHYFHPYSKSYSFFGPNSYNQQHYGNCGC